MQGAASHAALMATSNAEELLTILQTHFSPREEGWVWLALYTDDMPGGVVSQIEGEYEDPGVAAHALGRIINEVEPDRAYIALCRAEGRPRESDRELWRDLRVLVDRETLTDMVVFSDREAWSMRAEDAAAA